MKIAVYPGSFDPATLGHLDIIERASSLFDSLIVAVMVNPQKDPAFSKEERMEFLRRITVHFNNVVIDCFDGLLADYVKKMRASTVVKGLRALSDFEYEFQMALANKRLNPCMDTVFLMTSQRYMFLSSGMVRDIAGMNGDVSEFVPAGILGDIAKKFKGSER